MLLIRRDLDIVRPHGWLVLVRVIQALHVAQVGDVQRGNVVGRGEGEIDEATVLADVGAVENLSLVLILRNLGKAN